MQGQEPQKKMSRTQKKNRARTQVVGASRVLGLRSTALRPSRQRRSGKDWKRQIVLVEHGVAFMGPRGLAGHFSLLEITVTAKCFLNTRWNLGDVGVCGAEPPSDKRRLVGVCCQTNFRHIFRQTKLSTQHKLPKRLEQSETEGFLPFCRWSWRVCRRGFWRCYAWRGSPPSNNMG